MCGLHDQDELAALGDKMKMRLDNFHQVEWRSLTLWSCDFVVRMKGSLFLLACCGDALDLGISPSACTETFMASRKIRGDLSCKKNDLNSF